jgi:hypothetical protein
VQTVQLAPSVPRLRGIRAGGAFTGGMPRSHFDFDLLHDFLGQDKDYEVVYLGSRRIAKPGDLEEWFEDFQTPAPRDPDRGFRR